MKDNMGQVVYPIKKFVDLCVCLCNYKEKGVVKKEHFICTLGSLSLYLFSIIFLHFGEKYFVCLQLHPCAHEFLNPQGASFALGNISEKAKS